MALRTRIYTGEFWESSGTSLKLKLTAKRQNFDRIDPGEIDPDFTGQAGITGYLSRQSQKKSCVKKTAFLRNDLA